MLRPDLAGRYAVADLATTPADPAVRVGLNPPAPETARQAPRM